MVDFFAGCDTPKRVKMRWRVLAQRHHPDKGGDVETFQHMKGAYEQAKILASKPLICHACNGSGRIDCNVGFHTILITCRLCRGTGNIPRTDT